MFTKSITKLAALVLSLLALAGFASAQYDESIAQLMTSVDGMMVHNQQQIDYTNAQIEDAINRYVQDPQIQAAYNQCLQTSGMCGDIRWFAYNYVATGGFTDGGAWMNTTRQMDARTQQGWQGVQAAEQGSANAISGLNESIANSQAEWRNVMGGGSTWMDPSTGTGYNLPYGLQSGQTWYDAGTGQYYSYNPYNWDQGVYFTSTDGYTWQQLNQWQPGQ
jgi:hypothetical protein